MPSPATDVSRAIAPLRGSPQLGIGELAAHLARGSMKGDLFVAAADDVRGAAVAQALAAMTSATVIFCPGSDALPGDEAPASPANVGQRVAALRQLRLAQQKTEDRAAIVFITTGEALARRYPPAAAFEAAPPCVAPGDRLDLARLFEELIETGYIVDERVDEPGEVALRGHVLDVYPADAAQPVRIEVADGRVVAVRRYDPATQRTTAEQSQQQLGRVAEPPAGKRGVTLADHLPGATVAIEPLAEERRRRFLTLAADAAKRRPARAMVAIVSDRAWHGAVTKRPTLSLDRAGEPPRRPVEHKAPLRMLATIVREARDAGRRVALIGSARDLRFLRPRVAKALREEPQMTADWASLAAGSPTCLSLLEAPIERGFCLDDVVVLAAADLLGSRADRDDPLSAPVEAAFLGLGDIRIGDVVVHEDHGIGIVRGLAPMPAADGAEEAIQLEYAKGGMRLVPVDEAERIWRYGADADAVTLDTLDGHSWQKRRGAIDAAIAETARGMIALANEQAGRQAPMLDPDIAAYERFAAGFPFLETRDQARAIEAVRDDLASGKPMDRLIVGDVGFGKTEVALRAAALAALAGHQVAIAAPTTVLARQHLETFTARFAPSGITVAGLSRLSSPAERKRVRAGLADGTIQIVVGTGAIAGKGIAYDRLALVIIDEEQRFGAAEKDRLRGLGAGHVLTLSATPIPRTLQSALVGIRQLSVIATPPARRQPIRTAMASFDETMVRTALLRERSRGGQSFVVVPRIEDMPAVAATLRRLVPELDLLEAHGKMPADEIDATMVRFGRGEGDVLLATTIIEAGLDVPRANTMVMWRADRFGLSQLHQLRGRVGRGQRRGQVLLLTDPDATIAPRTLKRLRTLEAFDRLGAGFAISARDLDMRGAGDLLGEAQAGHMKLIGVDLYQHLLEAALRTARGEVVERWVPDLHLGLTGNLPVDWIPDDELRVTFYTRLARASDAAAIDALAIEMADRFGAIPDSAETLLAVARVRASARAARVARIDAGPGAIALTPLAAGWPARAPDGWVSKGERWLLKERIDDAGVRLERVEQALEEWREAA
ncbi:helicase-related protein [Sphingomonas sp.]|jgi:transcription-repair coupling factor (superfamily II helicase)|uniref:helicase-related protein n=1 Tax=Sphingomonas sp. TaxID=28214 RepID=UPI0035C81CB8